MMRYLSLVVPNHDTAKPDTGCERGEMQWDLKLTLRAGLGFRGAPNLGTLLKNDRLLLQEALHDVLAQHLHTPHMKARDQAAGHGQYRGQYAVEP